MSTPLPRDQFPVTRRLLYLDHAGIAPISRAAADAIDDYAARLRDNGRVGHDELYDRIDDIREMAARLMGTASDDIAFVKNTTEGLAFVSSGLDWQPGDRVVVANYDFPSTVYPWLALRDRDVRVDFVEPVGTERALPLHAFEAALDAGASPKVLAVSWVQFGRGWRTDLASLARLCHERGTLLCADVIQGLGVIPAQFAAWDVDFAAADGHKWLLAPEGIGVLYVAERCRDLLRPVEPGWASVVHRMEWDNLELIWDPSARRFEGGSPNHAGLAGLGASFELLLDAGVEQIWAHVDQLCTRLATGLPDVGATVLSDRGEGRSAIVTFTIEGVNPVDAADRLNAAGYVCVARAGGLRVSPHGYNTAEEIDVFVAVVDRLRSSQS